MTLDEARALRCGDLVHDQFCWPWIVDDELHAAGESEAVREGWSAIGISHFMRLRAVQPSSRGSLWLLGNADLDQLHMPEGRSKR